MGLIIGFMNGCTLPSLKQPVPLLNDQRVLLEESRKALDEGNHSVATAKLGQFFDNYPASVYTQKARLIYAELLEAQGHTAEAEVIYRSVYQITDSTDSSLSGEAMYLLAMNYQARGDDVKALALLTDLESRAERFLRKTLKAEIYARKMQIYTLREQKNEAAEFLLKAERELRRVIPLLTHEERQRDLPSCYFFMGSVSLDKMTDENILNYKSMLVGAHGYLFKALSFEKSPWSAKAGRLIVENYNKVVYTFDFLANKSEERNLKAPHRNLLGAEVISLVQHGILLIPPVDKNRNEEQKKVFTFLEEINKHVEKILFTPDASTGLTKRAYQ